MASETLAKTQATAADLDACAREPIQAPGQIQPQGNLLVLSGADLTIIQAAIGSSSAFSVQDVLNHPLRDALASWLALVPERIGKASFEDGPCHLGSYYGGQEGYHAIAHRAGPNIILELETIEPGEPGSLDELYPSLTALLSGAQVNQSLEELGALAAQEVRRITQFDRVLIYRFDEDWNGTVIAEDRNEVLPSYLDLRFPATDIPAQARELYRLNRLRLIADANYRPVPLEPGLDPVTGQRNDLSFATLRSVSPIHLEYMRNMGTGASMSISLLRQGQLWGLISCHNKAPRRVPYHVRTACDFIGQFLSLQFAGREQAILAEQRIALRSVQARLLASMAAADPFMVSLVKERADMLALTDATGAAIVFGGECRLLGETPAEPEVRRLADWLNDQRPDEIVVTDHLAGVLPDFASIKDTASGVLAVPISQVHSAYVLWFRPEVIRTVSWGGSPRKAVDIESGRIHPRQSFEVWKEAVSMRSRPWGEAEIEAAEHLRSAIVDIVLRKAEELAGMAEQLLRSNKELEAFSYSVSHDLRAPFRHIVGYAELLKQYEGAKLSERGHRYIGTIIESAISAGTLVDNLLSFSQMGRATLNKMTIDMDRLVEELRRKLDLDLAERAVEWRIDALPEAYGDPVMIRLVMQNLLENAVKFSAGRDPAIIRVGTRVQGDVVTYFVQDNGAGFDMAYVGKLFGVFQRLHRSEDFEGTGIGLANVKRIVEHRHGGRVWAEGAIDQGATIFFSLPRRENMS
ncbi:ATP-binding protein [Novosphingobium rosa]|uniref:ATP-binding protein n=1 Tax=Novosphingobium rosa TaxID=76978 RepID=UPI000AAB4C7C|nr:ATP-binding protein [Novosphingobium rosa]